MLAGEKPSVPVTASAASSVCICIGICGTVCNEEALPYWPPRVAVPVTASGTREVCGGDCCCTKGVSGSCEDVRGLWRSVCADIAPSAAASMEGTSRYGICGVPTDGSTPADICCTMPCTIPAEGGGAPGAACREPPTNGCPGAVLEDRARPGDEIAARAGPGTLLLPAEAMRQAPCGDLGV